MIPKFLAVTLIGAFLGFQCAVAITHQLDIKYTNGDELVLTTDHGNLPLTLLSEVCNYGVWIIYEAPNFSSEGLVEILPNLGPACTIPDQPSKLSARMVGSQTNNSLPSATFFNRANLGGQVLVITEDVPAPGMGLTVRSFITINTDYVEFFREVDYQGESFCVEVSPIGTVWFWEWDELSTPWNGELAMSARLGCGQESSTIIRPQAPSRRMSRKV